VARETETIIARHGHRNASNRLVGIGERRQLHQPGAVLVLALPLARELQRQAGLAHSAGPGDGVRSRCAHAT
jgi:hypothetical protein